MSEQNPENQVDETNDQEATPEAPVAAEPKPVEVAPADQSESKQQTLLGKDYEVSPDRGFRQVQPEAPQGQSVDEDSDDSES